MIRVLQVIGGLNRGGAETMIMNLYRAVDKTRVQFDFILNTDKPQSYTDEVLAMGGKIYVLPKFNGKNYFAIKRAWNKFFVEHPEYKILHSHVRSYASIYIPIAKKHGLKTIVHSHSTSNGKGLASAVKKLMQRSLRKKADYLFSCSEIAGEWLFGRRAVRGPKYKLIPNAIDTARYVFDEDVRAAKRGELSLDGKVVYGHVGRLHEAKNHKFLLDVFAKIHEKQPESALLIVGDGTEREKIENRIRELSLEDSVIMTGSRPDVNELMQAMDCFLFPSLWEGLPVTVVEAQAAGLACLVSDRVTSEVELSELVKYLPIDNADRWCDEAIAAEKQRANVRDKIIAAGYDIATSARDITEFYESNS